MMYDVLAMGTHTRATTRTKKKQKSMKNQQHTANTQLWRLTVQHVAFTVDGGSFPLCPAAHLRIICRWGILVLVYSRTRTPAELLANNQHQPMSKYCT